MVLKTDEFSRGPRSEGPDKGYRKLGGEERGAGVESNTRQFT